MRWLRSDPRAALEPAWRHYLMVGAPSRSQSAPVRLRGWPDVVTARWDRVRELWETHAFELLAEARRIGFEPAGRIWFEFGGQFDDVLPVDRVRQAWSAAFCQQHGY